MRKDISTETCRISALKDKVNLVEPTSISIGRISGDLMNDVSTIEYVSIKETFKSILLNSVSSKIFGD